MSEAGDKLIGAIEHRIESDPDREIEVRMPADQFVGHYIDPRDHKVVLVFLQPKSEPASCPCCERGFE
jgi:hypothetical protein